ncbi:MAG: Gfo/Idh/MocA family oxidoreductase [Oscillospiraceae bacterium]
MKILIIGFGSMGKRRARLIKTVQQGAELCCVDSAASRRDEAVALGITPYSSLSEATTAQSFDAAFVCTSPLSHASIISDLLDANISLFTELNLVSDGYSENIAKAKAKNLVLFLSNTMIYRKEPQFIINEVHKYAKPMSYSYHIGQYLPDWHPWESYKSFFVGDKRTGGVREIFGIDLPWIIRAFGEIVDITVQKATVSALDLPYPDTYTVMLRHKSGSIGVFMADVVAPKAVRNFEAVGDGLHLFWEGNPKALYKYNKDIKDKEYINTYASFEHDPRFSDNVVETAYADEISNFFTVLKGEDKPLYSFDEDARALCVMDKIFNA